MSGARSPISFAINSPSSTMRRSPSAPEFIEAMTLHGSVLAAESNSSDMLSSALASMYPAGHCKQVEPIPLSDDPVTFAGRAPQPSSPHVSNSCFQTRGRALRLEADP